MLSVLSAIYHGQAPPDLPTDTSLQDQRRRIFTLYVKRMLQRRGTDPRYPPKQITRWLSWLASQLLLHNQVEFSLERIQPDWLVARRSRWFYHLLVKIMVGLIVGLIYGVVFAFASGLIYRSPDIGLQLGLTYALLFGPVYGLVYGLDDLLVGGLMVGLIVGLLGRLLIRLLVPQNPETRKTLELTWSWPRIRLGLLVGLVVGLIYALIMWWLYGQVYGLIGGVAAWLIYALVSGLVARPTTDIKPAEVLTWSWRKMGHGLVKGLPYGLIFGLIFGVATRSTYNGLAVGGAGMLVTGLVTGMSGEMIDEQTYVKPNQGIWRSLKHGVLLTLSIGLLVGLSVGLLIGSSKGLVLGLALGLFFGLFFGLFVGLQHGGIACIQHMVLRFLLWRSKVMPWNYPHFLDYAAERILLRKVGGNYIFVHRLLLEYFAALYTTSVDNQNGQ